MKCNICGNERNTVWIGMLGINWKGNTGGEICGACIYEEIEKARKEIEYQEYRISELMKKLR